MQQIDAPNFPAVPRLQLDRRRVLTGLVGVGLLAVVVLLARSPGSTLSEAIDRTRGADPLLLLVGVVAEVGSFAGYAALTWLVVGRATPRVGAAMSAQITLAGTAVTRLLPTAGLGGVGLTLWALRRAGLSMARATSTLLTFLVLLYTVFLTALAAAGVAALTGSAGDAPTWIGLAPVVLGVTAVAVGGALGMIGPDRVAGLGRHTRAAATLADSVRAAARTLRSPDVRLVGALAWWGLDLAVLTASFAALGHAPPLGIIALGYFAGIVANTIPVPGAVSGGMTTVLVLCGVPLGYALPSVLVYRTISLWIPVPVGAAALVGLRRTARRWAEEDEAPSGAHTCSGRARPHRPPAAGADGGLRGLRGSGRAPAARIDTTGRGARGSLGRAGYD